MEKWQEEKKKKESRRLFLDDCQWSGFPPPDVAGQELRMPAILAPPPVTTRVTWQERVAMRAKKQRDSRTQKTEERNCQLQDVVMGRKNWHNRVTVVRN